MFDNHLALPGAWIGPELCWHIIRTLDTGRDSFYQYLYQCPLKHGHPFLITPLLKSPLCCASVLLCKQASTQSINTNCAIQACHNNKDFPKFCLGTAKSQLRPFSFYLIIIWTLKGFWSDPYGFFRFIALQDMRHISSFATQKSKQTI